MTNTQHGIPLATTAGHALRTLADLSGSAALAALDGETLLCERAMLRKLAIPGRTSAGGRCILFDAIGDTVALNLPRATDLELLPALLETDDIDVNDHASIGARISLANAQSLVARGRSMGMAIAAEHESLNCATSSPVVEFRNECVELLSGVRSVQTRRSIPLVVDLSALWAGPLATHLLWLAGAEVVKVESLSRPDAMREGDRDFYALLNQGKASVALNFSDSDDRRALLSLIANSDIVIEAARPRALAQLGVEVAQIVRATPGLVWITITGHGADGREADWIGFGDDCGVSGGLSAALRAASGRTGFVGDAIGDPLTGIFAALLAWERWQVGGGGRFAVAMSRVVAECLASARAKDPVALTSSLQAWSAGAGTAFPSVPRRPTGHMPTFGENTWSYLSKLAR